MQLILCCDYGLDDAAATVDALTHAGADGYERVVLVAIAGNVPCDVSLANAKKLTAHCPCDVPVLIVDTTMRPQPNEFLKSIHGEDGMGDLFAPCESTLSVIAFDWWVSSLEGAYDFVSLGPATLVPEILSRGTCRKFVLMGGNIAEEPNFHGYEFNHALDRAAFAQVILHPHVAITLDTCRVPALNVQERALAGGGLMRAIVNRCREMTFVSGEKGSYIWDDMAIKYLRHPEWFALEECTDRDGNRLTVARYRLGKPYEEIILL